MTTFASFLESHQRVRRPARCRALVVASAAAHAGVLVLLAVVTMHAPAAPAPEPVLVRLSLPVGRPRARPAPAPATPRQARSAPRPRLTQPALVAPPVEAPPASAEVEEELPEASEESEETDAGAEAAGVPGGVASAPPVREGPFELREVARPPSVLSRSTPVYPREARRDGVEGTVVLRVIVGVNGTVERRHTRVVRSVPGLDAAAIAAVESWRFSPALVHSGAAVRVVIEVPFQFYLR